MKRKIAVLIIFSLLLGLFLLGCTGEKEEEKEKEEKLPITTEVKVYFVSEDYVNGESADIKTSLIEEKATLSVDEEDMILSLLNLLREPKDKKSVTMLSEKIIILDAGYSKDENIVEVNLSSEGLTGGSLQESGLIAQIVTTINNHEIDGEIGKKVQFLVDGNKQETLMGNFDTTEPVGIENL